MEVVWTILIWLAKAVGFLLGGLLLLLLFLLLIILCVPIRYRLDLEKREAFLYGGRITWLFRFIQVIYQRMEKETIFELRICGFPIKREITHLDKEDADEKNFSGWEEDLWETDWQAMEEEEFKQKLYRYLSAGVDDPKELKIEVGMEEKENCMPDSKTDQLPEADIRSLVEKRQAKAEEEVIERLPQNKKQTVGEWLEEMDEDRDFSLGEVDEKLQRKDAIYSADKEEFSPSRRKVWKQKLDLVWRIFQAVREYFRKNTGIIRHILFWVFRILRSILPQKIDGQIHFGLNDPSHTGYVMAIFYLFYPEKRGKMVIDPDFEKFIVQGQIQVKGRIILIVLLYYALRIVLDFRIFRLIRLVLRLKKEITQDGESSDAEDNSNDKNAENTSMSASIEA